MIEFVGRLHPLIVHLPIGILLMAAGLHLLSAIQKTKTYESAAHASLLIGSLFSVIACITGYVIADNSYDSELISSHRNFGLITAFTALLILWINNSKKPSIKKKFRRKFNSMLYAVLIPLIFVTGHFGGSLTHGTDFLFPIEPESLSEPDADSIDLNSTVYVQLVKPIFKAKCYRCHSAKKQKGKLRLDSEDFIVKGGKSGSILKHGDEDPGELLYRIHLPIDDEDHMPPSDNDQLNSSEIDLLVGWINDGASFDAKLSSYPDSSLYILYARTKFKFIESNWWPTEKIKAPGEEAIGALLNAGVSIEFLSKENNYLNVSLVSIDSVDQNIWNSLLQIKDNIISFKINGALVSQEGLNKISSFKTLRRLYLNNIRLQNPNIEFLSSLKHLKFLNLSGVEMMDDQFSSLRGLKSLGHLVLFNTNIAEPTKRTLETSLPKCRIEYEKAMLDELASDTLIYRKRN